MLGTGEVAVKRALDIGAAGLLLVVLSPPMALIAGALRLSGRGSVIYRSLRVGRGGQLYQMLKFRTMAPDRGAGPEITASGDPRVTRFGHVLRATKLDELPQLINVLKGEMSLVGPRPEVPRYVAHYTPEQRVVLSMRPGITGLSQVLFRHEERLLRRPDPERYYLDVVMPAKLAIDLEYVRHRSMRRDLWILARTLGAIVRPAHVPTLPPALKAATKPSAEVRAADQEV